MLATYHFRVAFATTPPIWPPTPRRPFFAEATGKLGFRDKLAEAVRFELTRDVNPRQFSRLLPSTTRPRFRYDLICYTDSFGYG